MTLPPPDPRSPARTATPGTAQGCFAAFLALLGIAMVLPGVCSLVVLLSMGGDLRAEFVLLWIITFVIAAGGIMLARHALRMERAARAARNTQVDAKKVEDIKIEDKER
jgi:hypothetical protein